MSASVRQTLIGAAQALRSQPRTPDDKIKRRPATSAGTPLGCRTEG
jgi:hypothetical protein